MRFTTWMPFASGSASAAASAGRFSGQSSRQRAGTFTNSANAPGRCMPKIWRCAHRCVSPRSHRTQRPQGTRELLTTRAPTFQPDTADPTTAIVPQNSWPMTSGGARRGLRFLNVSSSLPHRPQAATWMRTSSGCGGVTSRSRISSRSNSG